MVKRQKCLNDLVVNIFIMNQRQFMFINIPQRQQTENSQNDDDSYQFFPSFDKSAKANSNCSNNHKFNMAFYFF
ncbi:hypothetical protein COW86_02180 [Candidatus Kuenenbacteria bacterium CG22_combo_CG10-13_8_21_14_all_39_9]|uniref:Uncharacterized protein n=1 Tax=Candidatus Kuenenbacteria bacterium CG22_combo_CG10-13_8_21_14_all_39_9 TaxID=1974621 RepID=A0A2H0D1Y6_9BACT|nr:MAG: hypothetical protein COW86_02180 [Candidatus Kuenenbacteria bacterium CG22_combo_CG10-13_8_21_14_all_39_9]